jgi:hypothetical protein
VHLDRASLSCTTAVRGWETLPATLAPRRVHA